MTDDVPGGGIEPGSHFPLPPVASMPTALT